MRIIYLHQYFNLPTDNGSTRSYEMARRLVDAGHEVFMITSDRKGRFGSGWHVTHEAGIEVHWLPVPYSNKMSYRQRIQAFLKFSWRAATRAASIPADVVFATSTPLTITLPGVYASKRQRIPMVFEVRDLWPEAPIAVGALKGPLIPPARWLERFAYRHSEQIIALSQRLKAGVVQAGYPAERIHVIPNGSDINLFNASETSGFQFRQRFDWLQERPLIVYTGTLGRVNGVGYLAHLAQAIQSLDPEIRFLIIGDGVEKPKVEKLAQELNVLGKNFFMLPAMPKTQIPMVLSAASVATSVVINDPRLWGDSANKIFDAFASGTPVVINHGGGMAALLHQTGAGLALSPTDIPLAARQLGDFLHDKEGLAKAAASARHLAELQFSRDKLAKELEDILLQAVDEFSQRR